MKNILLTLLLVFVSAGVNANTLSIKVGAGIRPPFLLSNGKGMGPDIINAFNLVQNEINFELVSLPISRRIPSLEEGWVEMVMWDNLQWGWPEDLDLTASISLLDSKDHFITSSSNEKNQSYFDDFENKIICGVNGYHYKFLNYETNYNKIKNKIKIQLVRTEEEAIKMTLNKRCDISVVSESTFSWFFNIYPEKQEQLFISDKFDTQYTRHFIIPAYSPITVKEINDIYNKAKKLGLLKSIYENYGQTLK